MRKLQPFIVFVVVSALGIAAAVFVWSANGRAERTRFDAVVDEAVARIDARFRQHMTLLDATIAYFEADARAVSAGRFAQFVDNFSIEWRHPGLLALGYAPLLDGRRPFGPDALRVSDDAPPFGIWPDSDQPWRAPIVLIEASDGTGAETLGFDMYSDPVRREAMEAAAQVRGQYASRRLQLAGGAAGAAGAGEPSFVVFAPTYGATVGRLSAAGPRDRPTGFVFAKFRVGDLFRATVEIPPVLALHVTAREADAPASDPIFVSAPPANGFYPRDLEATRRLTIAGREWLLSFRPTAEFGRASAQSVALFLGGLALICAAALTASLRADAREAAASAELAEARRRSLIEKDLLLREMQHRIKNSITRILAIARQTAASAPDLPSFSASFTERLRAMASAQDMLTRSKWQSVELRALLNQELSQVFGRELGSRPMTGPDVLLNETAAQALGLTFHELATNALKYGGGPEAGGAIGIGWTIEPGAAGERLVLDWTEAGATCVSPPATTGFGTKLIDSSIRMELGGTVERDWRPQGLAIRLAVPLERAVLPAPTARRRK